MRFFYCLRGWDGGCHYHYHVLWLRSLRGGVGDNDDNNNRRVCWGGVCGGLLCVCAGLLEPSVDCGQRDACLCGYFGWCLSLCA